MSDLWYWDKSRVISLIIVCIYLIVVLATGGASGLLVVLIFIILPLGCIWFGDAIGGYTGFAGPLIPISPTPGVFIKFIGWVLLLLPIITRIIAVVCR